MKLGSCKPADVRRGDYKCCRRSRLKALKKGLITAQKSMCLCYLLARGVPGEPLHWECLVPALSRSSQARRTAACCPPITATVYGDDGGVARLATAFPYPPLDLVTRGEAGVVTQHKIGGGQGGDHWEAMNQTCPWLRKVTCHIYSFAFFFLLYINESLTKSMQDLYFQYEGSNYNTKAYLVKLVCLQFHSSLDNNMQLC